MQRSLGRIYSSSNSVVASDSVYRKRERSGFTQQVPHLGCVGETRLFWGKPESKLAPRKDRHPVDAFIGRQPFSAEFQLDNVDNELFK
jgi:hypothetical protein